jgi:hypothetical protein
MTEWLEVSESVSDMDARRLGRVFNAYSVQMSCQASRDHFSRNISPAKEEKERREKRKKRLPSLNEK